MHSSAVAILCREPQKPQVEFYATLTDDYDVYFISDSPCSETGTAVTCVYIPDAECESASFTMSGTDGHAIYKRVTAWDKAFYLFSVMRPDYERVWFLEDDVFVPTRHTLTNIDVKYGGQHDVLCPPFSSIAQDPYWGLWPLASLKQRRPHTPSSWWHGMVCAVRLSQRFLQEIRSVAEKNKVLYFIEIMIPSFGVGQGQFLTRSISELDHIVYRTTYSPNEICTVNLYHPLKGALVQQVFREAVDASHSKYCASSSSS